MQKNKYSEKEKILALKRLAEMPDEDIDYSDIPPITDSTGWSKLHPKKKDIHALLDEDVLRWVKTQSKSVSGFINKVLRDKMLKTG